MSQLANASRVSLVSKAADAKDQTMKSVIEEVIVGSVLLGSHSEKRMEARTLVRPCDEERGTWPMPVSRLYRCPIAALGE